MIPRDEIVMLRDWLYESDRITMGGIADINKLLKKYEVSPVVRCKDCKHEETCCRSVAVRSASINGLWRWQKRR